MATRQKPDSNTERMARSLDVLAEYERFCDVVPARARRMVLKTLSPGKVALVCPSLGEALLVNKALQGNVHALRRAMDRIETDPAVKGPKPRYCKLTKGELVDLLSQKHRDKCRRK